MSKNLSLSLAAAVVVTMSAALVGGYVSAGSPRGPGGGGTQPGEERFIECVRNGDLACAQRELSGGTNPDARDGKDKESSTALMVAVTTDHADLLELLVGKGADVNAKTTQGRTALMWAAWKGKAGGAQALV